MPTNLYGYGDRYDLNEGHVAAAMIMKVHAAKVSGASSLEIWGTGTPRREFLFSEDLADGCVFMMKNYSDKGFLNVGTGVDITIRELAEAVSEIAGWSGQLIYDGSKPDGMPRKVMDVGRLKALGWTAKTSLNDGMRRTYVQYVADQETRSPEA
jgi:GDP-L-fucose synthase